MNLTPTFEAVQEASLQLSELTDQKINDILLALADAAIGQRDYILTENRKDLERMDPANPKYDRLKLTEERLQGIAADIRNVATLPSPLDRTLKENILPNGLHIRRVSVPFGVIGIIYEARPNVSFDVFSLCLKSGNACILKGGSDADHSNRAILHVIHQVLERFRLNPHIAELLPATHEATAELLHANRYVDLLIPRGSSNLIQFVRQHATVPVIETGAGICHTYFDLEGDLQKGAAIIHNAKTRRVSVCNALDCLIIHIGRLGDLPQLCAPLAESHVILCADGPAYAALQGKYPQDLLKEATDEDFGTEFLDYKMSVKTVNTFEEALKHIQRYSSKHSECIVTENPTNAALFCRKVDAAIWVWRASSSTSSGCAMRSISRLMPRCI